jgi:hypothetical protein
LVAALVLFHIHELDFGLLFAVVSAVVALVAEVIGLVVVVVIFLLLLLEAPGTRRAGIETTASMLGLGLLSVAGSGLGRLLRPTPAAR